MEKDMSGDFFILQFTYGDIKSIQLERCLMYSPFLRFSCVWQLSKLSS